MFRRSTKVCPFAGGWVSEIGRMVVNFGKGDDWRCFQLEQCPDEGSTWFKVASMVILLFALLIGCQLDATVANEYGTSPPPIGVQ